MFALKEINKLEVDTKCAKHVGVSLNWDYVKDKVHMFMPWYATEALQQFKPIWSGKTKD